MMRIYFFILCIIISLSISGESYFGDKNIMSVTFSPDINNLNLPQSLILNLDSQRTMLLIRKQELVNEISLLENRLIFLNNDELKYRRKSILSRNLFTFSGVGFASSFAGGIGVLVADDKRSFMNAAIAGFSIGTISLCFSGYKWFEVMDYDSERNTIINHIRLKKNELQELMEDETFLDDNIRNISGK